MKRKLESVRHWAPWVLALAAAACADEGPGSMASSVAPPDDGAEITIPDEAAAPEVRRRHEELEQPRPISVQWEDSLTKPLTRASDGFAATLRNHTERELDVVVLIMGYDNDQPVATPIDRYALAPQQQVAVSVPLSTIPVQTQNAPTPIKLIAVVQNPDLPIQVPSTDLSVVFDSDYEVAFASSASPVGPEIAAARGTMESDSLLAELLLLREGEVPAQTLIDDALAGASDTTIVPAGRVRVNDTWQDLSTLRSVDGAALLGAASITQLSSQTALSLANFQFPRPTPDFGYSARLCAGYAVSFVDSALGEDNLTENGKWYDFGAYGRAFLGAAPPARYARAVVRERTTGRLVFDGYLDASGCASFTAFKNDYHTLTLSTLLQRETTQYDVRQVFARPPDRRCDKVFEGKPDGETCESTGGYTRDFLLSRSSPSASVHSNYEMPAFRVAAVAGVLLAMPDNGLKPNDTYVAYANSGCDSFYWREACAGTVAYYGLSIGVGAKDTTLEKFVIGHEMGHQMQAKQGVGTASDYDAADPGRPASCSCDHVTVANRLHCLQSRHPWATAFTEGWAHFVAARIMNRSYQTDCTFTYYKELLRDDGGKTFPPVVTDCSATTRWLANHCAKEGYSTEWDILNFLRALDRDGPNGLTMTELYALQRRAGYNLDWPKFLNAAGLEFGVESDKHWHVGWTGAFHGVTY